MTVATKRENAAVPKTDKEEAAHIHYVEIGLFPVFVGVCCDEKRFDKEMKRLGVKDNPFIYPGGHATCHQFDNGKHGGKLVIIAYRPAPSISKEQQAGLAAHEAMHAVQYINKHVSHHQRFCEETEAYLVQAITQGLLSELWSGRKRATTP